MTTVDISADVARFKALYAKRRLFTERLALFNQLKVSVKFDELAKPECFDFLINAVAELTTPRNAADVLDALLVSKAGWAIRDDVSEEEADAKLCRMARKLFEVMDGTPDELIQIGNKMKDAGLGYDYSHLVAMAALAGMDEDRIGHVLNSTYRQRYYLPLVVRTLEPEFA